MQLCLAEVQRLCSRMFDGVNPNTPYRWKRSAPAEVPLGRRTLLSPADMTRLSEHFARVTAALCLSVVTIRGKVLLWLDAEGPDVRPRKWWVKQHLSLSYKKPAMCVKELHSPEQQHANTHRLFIKLSWPAQRRPRREHRRDVLPPPAGASDRVGPSRREASSAAGQHEGGHDIHSRMDRGPLDMLVQIVHAAKTDAVLPEQPWLEHTHHVTSEKGRAAATTILQLTTTLDDVVNTGKEGQAWILLWDKASIHASEATLAAIVLCFIPQHSTSFLQPCDVAVFRSFLSCIQAQASATLARSVLDGSFDDVVMNKAWRRQSSAE